MGIANGLLFLRANQSTTNGIEAWRTDGTAAGTFLLKDINPGSFGSDPIGFADLGGFAVFFATDGVTGIEPWRTDGTNAGTVLIKDLHPGAQGSLSSQGFLFAPVGAKRALFAGTDGTTGIELFRTDGTAAGTALHQDLFPGSTNSNTSWPVQAGCRLFFTADNGTAGTELFALDTMAMASPYGFACAGSTGAFPHISANGGAPSLGNNGFGLRVTNGRPSTAAVVLVHLRRGELTLGGGCTYYGDPTGLLLVGATPTDLGGTGTYGLPIPPDVSLACGELFAQFLVVDAGGAYLGQVSLTEGLHLVLNPN
jgi:ELWxxDGT repeat protein